MYVFVCNCLEKKVKELSLREDLPLIRLSRVAGRKKIVFLKNYKKWSFFEYILVFKSGWIRLPAVHRHQVIVQRLFLRLVFLTDTRKFASENVRNKRKNWKPKNIAQLRFTVSDMFFNKMTSCQASQVSHREFSAILVTLFHKTPSTRRKN